MAQVEGFVAPGFEAVRDAFAASLDAGDELGACFAAMREGEFVVDIWGGHVDRAKERPWQRDTLTPVYSTTKAVAAVVVALCVDRKLLRYEDRVADVWPEFGQNGKDRVTIAETLSHQAGVPGFIEPIDPDLWLDPPGLCKAIEPLAPLWPPGTASGYHPMTWGYIAGEIVRRATGRSLGTILREDICAPLKIDFSIGTPVDQHIRCPEMQKPRQGADFGEITPPKRAAFFTPWAAPKRGGAIWRQIEIPSANGHGAARSVAQLFNIFVTGGAIEGRTILSPDAYAQLVRPRISGPDLVLPFDCDWRTGLLGNAQFFYGPNRAAFGHSGSGGSCGFGDPVARVSAGYVMNKQSHHLMGDPRSLRLIEALYACFKN